MNVILKHTEYELEKEKIYPRACCLANGLSGPENIKFSYVTSVLVPSREISFFKKKVYLFYHI